MKPNVGLELLTLKWSQKLAFNLISHTLCVSSSRVRCLVGRGLGGPGGGYQGEHVLHGALDMVHRQWILERTNTKIKLN